MTGLISLFINLTVLSMMLFLILRNVRYKTLVETRDRVVPVLLFVSLALFSLETMTGGNVCLRISFYLTLLVHPLMFLASSVWKPKLIRGVCFISFVLQICFIAYSVMCLAGGLSPLSDETYLAMSLVSALSVSFTFVYGIWMQIRDVRSVMEGGTVLMNLGLSMDVVYLCMFFLMFIMILASGCASGGLANFLQCASAFFGTSLLVAQCVRISYDSFFVFMHKHERRIVESLKVSQVEIANGVREATYRQLYDRIVEYFERDKPFLDNNLTINDVVKVVFSNKVYISRAISQFTGRNFCQFVNYYRISYSKDCFRENPELKITEMAEMSGFNSVVTYNMAFRLFMNENPSDWCRKERQKIRKKKK